MKGVVGYHTLNIKRTLIKGPFLDTGDLDYVLNTLDEAGFSQTKWKPLCDALGLYFTTLEAIEAEYAEGVQECLRQCLVQWLERADDVDVRGGPTMASLCYSLEDIGEKIVADYIRKNINKDSPGIISLKKYIACIFTDIW
ncbi:PREDICTED: uncharacterized protein LOC109584494 isoform X1 [Amphimedon queenslandica]|nr:PREDICTED: uncharacterized protein LOC109584494 isoform X1 [Amphimedon queenslandica]XP_019855817.1 PREDICTED: uncharacterized protein LOC109584494 isoform X1 [Amphimedon queenslandica]|eukprot:XP_019855816.1 PREDICTED: uncharacterized protein LOC109584494 isoform X1 [Amphimedon queenslandica]